MATGERSLSRFERAFYQFSIDLLPGSSGGTVVRVIAKITAWYADPEPWKSGYQVLPSNGRLELDLLDRLKERLGGKSDPSLARADMQAPRPKLDLSTGLPNSLSSNRSPVNPAAGSPSSDPGGDEVAALRAKREAEEKHIQQLNAELQNLQEIQRNQAHPLNLVVVKNNDTPVLPRPSAGARPLFKAAGNDEFEFLDAEGEWIHVQISGVSRGYIRRSSLDLPEFIAAHLQPSNGNTPNEKRDVFRIAREETAAFPASWETLRGKQVKILYRPASVTGYERKQAVGEARFCSFHFAEIFRGERPVRRRGRGGHFRFRRWRPHRCDAHEHAAIGERCALPR